MLSLSLTVKVKSPGAEGVPPKTPVPRVKETPGGSDPELTNHL